MTSALIYVGLHAALCVSVLGALTFAWRACGRKCAECQWQRDRRREAVCQRLDAEETTRVWRGAAGLANDRARQAEEASRQWFGIAGEGQILIDALFEALEKSDPVNSSEPQAPARETRLN